MKTKFDYKSQEEINSRYVVLEEKFKGLEEEKNSPFPDINPKTNKPYTMEELYNWEVDPEDITTEAEEFKMGCDLAREYDELLYLRKLVHCPEMKDLVVDVKHKTVNEKFDATAAVDIRIRSGEKEVKIFGVWDTYQCDKLDVGYHILDKRSSEWERKTANKINPKFDEAISKELGIKFSMEKFIEYFMNENHYWPEDPMGCPSMYI